ncbi:MAG: hypothetical protein JW748_10965 [Anaerolineales bacterium]|nr:hypothetical protein [Anaerolineales bacterium]
MNKFLLQKLFWIFWFATTVLTGILAGFMVSHSIMLGRFFNWYIESDNLGLLHQTFTVFRETHTPGVLYNTPLYLAFLSGVAWTVLACILKRDRIIAVVAGLSTFWVGNIFFLSLLNKAEEAVLSGGADAAMTQYYLSINLPLHTSFAVIYLASLCLLLWVPLKEQRQSAGVEMKQTDSKKGGSS